MGHPADTARARLPLAALLLVLACGGGGEVRIPPFWVWGKVVAADLDGDGRPEVAVAAVLVDGSSRADQVRVFPALAGGGFGPPAAYAVAADPWGLCVADLDGDGRPDLVATIPAVEAPVPNQVGDSGGLSILRQDVAFPGHFFRAVWVRTGGAADAAGVADFTGDGHPDVAVADGVRVNSRVLLLAQSPSQAGTLLPPVSVPVGTGHGYRDLAAADVDGDGRPDLVLAGNDVVAVLLQQAGGGFASPTFLPAGSHVEGVAAADLDGDGRMDLVAANAGNAPDGGRGGATVTVFLQRQPGQFTATSIPVPDGARQVAVGDLDGDGLPDLAVVSLVYPSLSTPSRVSVLRQSSAQRGAFVPGGTYDGTLSSNFLALADLDGDGRTDILLNEGPSVMVQTATPGVFASPRPLR
ncbi:hypothetical protein GETHPA_21030 [Geothrix rubra]|uniref:VCBS repeat-containing protein n=1 Tax=Geothrix rubra TaxID=2927977 RepID=A0ABQ5Q718_9BACT|nr:VCBS repeat-containing protein [Geothrix rubra]GLH70570.1 hypothetical protein GETHPA_21030 [Geothrix rubra]